MYPTHEREIRAITRNRTETDILQKRLGKLERAKTELNLSRHFQTTSVRRFMTECQRTSGYSGVNTIEADSNEKLIENKAEPPRLKKAHSDIRLERGVGFLRDNSGTTPDEQTQKMQTVPIKPALLYLENALIKSI
jgi:hypothetical protein